MSKQTEAPAQPQAPSSQLVVPAFEPNTAAAIPEPALDISGSRGLVLGLRPHVDKGKGKEQGAPSRKRPTAIVDKGKGHADDKVAKKPRRAFPSRNNPEPTPPLATPLSW